MFPSARISQLHKARIYAKQPERFRFVHPMQAVFEGDHRNHVLAFRGGHWHCDCAYAAASDFPCKHTMALEMLGQCPQELEEEAVLAEELDVLYAVSASRSLRPAV